MTLQVRFTDPDRLIDIPPLDVEEVSAVAIANHVRQYVQRREPKWHVAIDAWYESGAIILKSREITFKAYRA